MRYTRQSDIIYRDGSPLLRCYDRGDADRICALLNEHEPRPRVLPKMYLCGDVYLIGDRWWDGKQWIDPPMTIAPGVRIWTLPLGCVI